MVMFDLYVICTDR